MSAVITKLASYGLVCIVWLGTSMAFAQQRSQTFSVAIHASACSMLGAPVRSFSKQVTVGGTPVEMPYFLMLIDESDLRLMVDGETVDLGKLRAKSSIIPIKRVDDEVSVGDKMLSAEGRLEVANYCRLFR